MSFLGDPPKCCSFWFPFKPTPQKKSGRQLPKGQTHMLHCIQLREKRARPTGVPWGCCQPCPALLHRVLLLLPRTKGRNENQFWEGPPVWTLQPTGFACFLGLSANSPHVDGTADPPPSNRRCDFGRSACRRRPPFQPGVEQGPNQDAELQTRTPTTSAHLPCGLFSKWEGSLKIAGGVPAPSLNPPPRGIRVRPAPSAAAFGWFLRQHGTREVPLLNSVTLEACPSYP